MEIINYFDLTEKDKEYYKNEISKSDWSAGQSLYEILKKKELKALCGEKTKLFLLVDNRNLISFCTLAERDEIKSSNLGILWIGFLFTFKEYRGNRYSELLIKKSIKEAKNMRKAKVCVSTNEIGFYEKYGFEYIGEMETIHKDISRIYIYYLNKLNCKK